MKLTTLLSKYAKISQFCEKRECFLSFSTVLKEEKEYGRSIYIIA